MWDIIYEGRWEPGPAHIVSQDRALFTKLWNHFFWNILTNFSWNYLSKSSCILMARIKSKLLCQYIVLISPLWESPCWQHDVVHGSKSKPGLFGQTSKVASPGVRLRLLLWNFAIVLVNITKICTFMVIFLFNPPAQDARYLHWYIFHLFCASIRLSWVAIAFVFPAISLSITRSSKMNVAPWLR